jgi:hypothetical protein
MADDKLPRPLRTFPPELWARLDPAQRATFIRLWQRDLRTFTLGQWAQLPSPVRNAVNWLRQERHLSPYPEPEVDRSPKPYVPAPGLLDPSPLTRAVLDSRDPKEREILWQQLNAAADSLLTAHDGDPSMLASRLRAGVATPEECRFAADLLEGKVERPDHRPSTLDRKLREDTAKILLRAWWLAEPQQREKSRGTVFNLVKRDCRLERAEAYEILKQIRAEVVEHAELVGGAADGAVVDAATATRAEVGFVIRKQDERRQRPRRRRKAKTKSLGKGEG